MSPQARYVCRYVASAPMDKIYTFTLKPEILKELEHLMDRYLHRAIDKKFKSLPILETVDRQ
jgi:DNA repair protein RecO (recombination protein O)